MRLLLAFWNFGRSEYLPWAPKVKWECEDGCPNFCGLGQQAKTAMKRIYLP